MKHIRIYESFEDHLDPSTRDIFGLTAEVEIANYNDEWVYVMTGPIEHEGEAEEAAGRMRPYIVERYQDWYTEDDAEDTELNDYLDDYVFNHIPKSLYEPIGYKITRKPIKG